MLLVSVLAAACGPAGGERTGGETAATPAAIEAWRTDPAEPYPYTTPIPPREPTPIDGAYVRDVSVEAAGGPPVPCRRCAPYRIYAGETELVLDSGRYHVAHEGRGNADYGDFTASGHFVVDGDEVTLSNDSNCPSALGTYGWQLASEALVLELVRDDCAFGDLRARYLTLMPWAPVA